MNELEDIRRDQLLSTNKKAQKAKLSIEVMQTIRSFPAATQHIYLRATHPGVTHLSRSNKLAERRKEGRARKKHINPGSAQWFPS